jgi:7,8-dihydropterin-6-yl-methyl-4-(beta-D-ribofuranosyl)aminobenzene 5'-phosphate synthase
MASAVAAAPQLDELRITVVVDSYFDGLAPDEERARLTVLRGRGLLLGQHGLSLYLETWRGEEERRLLLDFGMTGEVLAKNVETLGIDTSAIDALILSHGHIDHFGGLAPFLAARRGAMRGDLPLYLGGEDVFCHRYHLFPGGRRRSYGVLDRRSIAEAQVGVVIAEEPAVVAEHAMTTGAIPRVSFEKVQPNTYVETGLFGGFGCCGAAPRAKSARAPGDPDLFVDDHWAEHATFFVLRERGLVVITSCGHAGVINSVRQARRVAGTERVHAVVGGFHLSPARPEYVTQVVDALRDIDPDYIVPMHCTGAGFIHQVAREMPEKLVLSYVGSQFHFHL